MYGVCIIGNLVQEPELRFTNTSKAMMNFTVAVNRKDKNGTELVDFHRCVAWGELAEHLAMLPKGTRLICYGRLSNRSWEDNEGNKKFITELVCDDAGPSARWAEVSAQKTGRSQYRPTDTGSIAEAMVEAVERAAPKIPDPAAKAQAADAIAAARAAVQRPVPQPKRMPPPPPMNTDWSEDPF